ncbi:PREDICTED: rhomboid domain-containing protein 2 [Pseudopodoces humilis]|uniref:rhomboid domain-containing protein 2 n=1 Tax=Pseudopodoces humilis TaxID=181119 RepID=UPI0006B7D8DE|nr:PREDICTED: rhomboid domain-containing protein 2 [Pseudopodoces humilis]
MAAALRARADCGAGRPISARGAYHSLEKWGGTGVHRLITYIFIYEDLISLACGAVIIWYFAGSFEKNVGTVKHCILTAAFSVLSALLYLFLEPLVSRLLEVGDAKGFMPVAFATLGVSTTRSRMKRTLLFGCRVPVVLVPWLGLCIAWFVPQSSLLGNFCGLLVGKVYGLGYCFCLDFPESVGTKLDHVFPFTLLKRIPGLKYIPGSLAERRASENSMIKPVPGTYPTQSYHCPSPLALPAHSSAQSQGFHHSHALGHQGPQQGRAAGHSLSSSLCQATGAFGECPGQARAGASLGQCCQLGKFSVPQHMCPAQPQPPAATDLLAGVQQAPGYPAAPVAPVSAEFTRVQVY